MKPSLPPLRTVGDATGTARATSESDEVLMVRFVDGDRGAFEALFERYREPVYAYLSRIVDKRTSEDLLQTTFLSVIRARGRFDRGARFKPWLYAIATNAARDFLRRHRAEQLTAEGELSAHEEATRAPEVDPGLQKAVARALQQLPESQRLAIVMHRFQNLTFAEIAEALDLTESAVKVRAHRGYQRLRELLKKLWEER
ncbi:MAG TPA: RNA polymerase sigma factor [Myxococcaceae bacterium]|nr:RNA polymerase sigma factor [Myxococcaceae bacterium]